jgi:O-antigen/teichoic acid export membrane protein
MRIATKMGDFSVLVFNKLFRHREDENAPGHSYSLILKGISTSLAGRGVAVITSFFAVPLTVRYLGGERYGVWITLTSILGWLTIFDLGIGNTAINSVAEALAHRDFESARLRINTAYAALAGIAAIIGLGVIVAWHWISWPAVLGARSSINRNEITLSAAIACFIFLANFPLTVTSRILGACKKVTVANYWNSAAGLLSLLLLVIATRMKVGLPGLVFAISGSSLLIGILSASWLYYHYEWLTPTLKGIQWKGIVELLSTGLPFFAVQISGLILYQTDNIIIAQIMGAKSVTPYSITWKLFSYASVLQVAMLPSLWPAYADASARRDLSWMRRTYRYSLRTAIGTSLIFSVILVLVAKTFILLWAGRSAVPSTGLVATMAIWTVLGAWMWCSSILLGAVGRVKRQAVYCAIGAAVNIGASILLGRLFGLIGIILGTICAFLFCIVIPQSLEARTALSEND